MENIYRRERLVGYLAHPRTQARRRSCPGDAARKRTLAAPLPSQPASPAHRRTLLPASSLVGDSRAHNVSCSLLLPRPRRRQPPPLRLEFRGFSGFVYAFAQLLCWGCFSWALGCLGVSGWAHEVMSWCRLLSFRQL
jgi:hypothetical protein